MHTQNARWESLASLMQTLASKKLILPILISCLRLVKPLGILERTHPCLEWEE